jgi:hypothetical protein
MDGMEGEAMNLTRKRDRLRLKLWLRLRLLDALRGSKRGFYCANEKRTFERQIREQRARATFGLPLS